MRPSEGTMKRSLKRHRTSSRISNRGSVKRARKEPLHGGQPQDVPTFFTNVKKEIAYLFATHWRYPDLKKYIVWFYNQLVPSKQLGKKMELPPQTASPRSLIDFFMSNSDFGDDVTPLFSSNFNAFFGDVTCKIVNADFMGYNWLVDEIYLLAYTEDNYKDHKRIYPGETFQWSDVYRTFPVWAQIGVKTEKAKYRVAITKYERIISSDFTLLVRFFGRKCWMYKRKEAPSGAARLVPHKEFDDPVEGTLEHVELAIRVTWNGPSLPFRNRFTDEIPSYPYKGHVDWANEDYAYVLEEGVPLWGGPATAPQPKLRRVLGI